MFLLFFTLVLDTSRKICLCRINSNGTIYSRILYLEVSWVKRPTVFYFNLEFSFIKQWSTNGYKTHKKDAKLDRCRRTI